MTTIKDIYVGKPDAKDEVETDGIDSFLKNYVVPTNFDIESLINGTKCFVSGYKGTGKTAVLYYLDHITREKDAQTVSSFVFFKGDYSDLKKQEMQQLAKRITSAISIGRDVVLEGTDFEIIWRWILYTRIIEDNQNYNYGIYNKNSDWDRFEKVIGAISYDKKKRFLSFPAKISLSLKDNTQQNSVIPTCEIDFKNTKVEETENYRTFARLIDEADELFKNLARTDIPYYIYIDELEAYYGDEVVFKRDLRLIRDLLFTVKKLNLVTSAKESCSTKIICSIRTEIVNAINRFIVSKELNKITSGFDVPLKWDYTNTNSFNHPIMQILVKRIEYGEKKKGDFISEKRLIEKWFPERIDNSYAANYLLNNSWCKPRDIVRLIQAAQSNLAASNDKFNQYVIDTSRKKYSQESLIEIQEEMKALYTPDEIDCIISCLTGFKRVFSFEEIQNKAKKYFQNSVLDLRLAEVLKDLYRLGIIGNHIPKSKLYRWHHKGDDEFILDDTWMIIIHPALLSALSVNSIQDQIIDKRNIDFKAGEKVNFTIKKIVDPFAYGEIGKNGKLYPAVLHISQVSFSFCNSILDYLAEQETYPAIVMGFNKRYNNWELTRKGLD